MAGDNPRTVNVPFDETVETTFEVTCVADVGDLQVNASSSGADLPAGYTVVVDGTLTQSIAANGSVVFQDLARGDHNVLLVEIAQNCAVQGENPKTVAVPFDDVVSTTFDVVCEANVGDLQVTTSTTGTDFPSSYTVEVDGGAQSQTVGPNDVVTFSDLAEGDHTVELVDVALNCTVSGNNPRTVSVPFGGVGATTFDVTCEALGDIVFQSDRDGNNEVYIMRGDGSNPQRLTNDPASDRMPVFSPDGTQIAFTSDRDAGQDDIWVMNRDGTGVTQLTTGFQNREPAWSPDGSRIVFTRERSDIADVLVMDADGSNVVNLTDSPSRDDQAEWSPDGSQIVFRSDRDGDFKIYVMNADGSGATELSSQSAGNPTWSPDGTKIAFVSDVDGTLDIWVMNADGSNPVNLTDNAAQDGEPAWNPTSSKITFSSDRGGAFDIYVMDADGTNVQRLTSSSGSDLWPSWSRQ